LTAITKKTFDQIKGFDYDFSLGTSWDDNALILKIKISNIKVVAVNNDKEKVMGIHQWHPQTLASYNNTLAKNESLYKAKKKFYDMHNKYIDLLQDHNPYNIEKRIKYLFGVLG
jgi:hypothetical protein